LEVRFTYAMTSGLDIALVAARAVRRGRRALPGDRQRAHRARRGSIRARN